MKRNCCSTCCQEIDSKDFYLESKRGKICSDCLVKAGPIDAESAHLFKPRGPKGQKPPEKERRCTGALLSLKEAL